jgi:hypothetical protein
VCLDHANSPFSQENEKLSGRNDAAWEASSSDPANGYASENDVFSFSAASQSSRKTAQSCLENLCVRAIKRPTTVNSLSKRFQANREKLYASEMRRELIQTTGTYYCRDLLRVNQAKKACIAAT